MPADAHNPRHTTVLAVLICLAAACRSEPDTRVYVTSGATDRVYVLDGITGRVRDSIAIDPRPTESDQPHGIVASPAGDYLFVTVAHGEPTLWKYTLPTGRLVGRVALRQNGAGRVGITPTGITGFVPDYYRDDPTVPGSVAVISLHDLRVERTIRVCTSPHDAQTDPAGSRIAIACSGSDEVVVMSTSDGSMLSRFFVGPDPGPPGHPRYRPMNLVWNEAGTLLYVTLNLTGGIGAYTADGRALGAMGTGAGPTQLALAPGGAQLVVANRGAGTVTVLHPGRMQLLHEIPISTPHPHGVTVSAHRAFVAAEGDTQSPGAVIGIDLVTGAVLWSTAVGSYNVGVTAVTH